MKNAILTLAVVSILGMGATSCETTSSVEEITLTNQQSGTDLDDEKAKPGQ